MRSLLIVTSIFVFSLFVGCRTSTSGDAVGNFAVATGFLADDRTLAELMLDYSAIAGDVRAFQLAPDSRPRLCTASASVIGTSACGWPREVGPTIVRFNTRDPGTAGAVPFLPWPPPSPSSLIEVSQRALPIRGRYADLAGRIRSDLVSRGYDQLLYYGVPGGFAITTELERIERDGRPVAGNRFTQGRLVGAMSVLDYIKRAFMGDRGRFRVFVFVVTDQAFSPANFYASEQDVDRWRTAGSYVMPAQVGSMPAPAGTRVTILVYEFFGARGRARGLSPATDRLPAERHRRWLGY